MNQVNGEVLFSYLRITLIFNSSVFFETELSQKIDIIIQMFLNH